MSELIPNIHSLLPDPNRINAIKNKKQKELQMHVKRLWGEEALKRQYSREIKERQKKAENINKIAINTRRVNIEKKQHKRGLPLYKQVAISHRNDIEEL